MKNKNSTSTVKSIVVANIVPILFLAISLVGVYYSHSPIAIILGDVVARFDRNGFLVLSLLIPVLAGMGLNFGIVLGAMSGQVGLFIITLFGIKGITGLLVAALISLPLSILLGYLVGVLLNKTKGQEMITSLILGFVAMGVYQFIFLFFIGGIVKIDAPGLLLPNGVGVRNTIDLINVKAALDNLILVDIFTFCFIAAGILLAYALFLFIKKKKTLKQLIFPAVSSVALIAMGVIGTVMPQFRLYRVVVKVPVVSYGIIALLCLFITFLFKTKLGQDMRAVGQNMEIAEVSGINVDKVRIKATTLSIVLAGFGQIMFLQNIGNISTYNAHENVGMFAAAALLIGGASVSKAKVSQAIIGTLLFHLLFNVSPVAGKNIFGMADIGEYFRVFVAYGIIAVTLALHAWRKAQKQRARDKANNEI